MENCLACRINGMGTSDGTRSFSNILAALVFTSTHSRHINTHTVTRTAPHWPTLSLMKTILAPTRGHTHINPHVHMHAPHPHPPSHPPPTDRYTPPSLAALDIENKIILQTMKATGGPLGVQQWKKARQERLSKL